MIDYYRNLGIKHFRIDLYNEDYNNTIRIIKLIKDKII